MLWTGKFIVCAAVFGGCLDANLKENKVFKDKDECEVFVEEQSDVLLLQMEQMNIFGEIHYGCVEYNQKERRT